VLWKALPEHNPTKLDLAQNSNFTASGDFPKINYTLCHFNYYGENISPKIARLVYLASQYNIASLKI
jgi:hypothetical protein